MIAIRQGTTHQTRQRKCKHAARRHKRTGSNTLMHYRITIRLAKKQAFRKMKVSQRVRETTRRTREVEVHRVQEMRDPQLISSENPPHQTYNVHQDTEYNRLQALTIQLMEVVVLRHNPQGRQDTTYELTRKIHKRVAKHAKVDAMRVKTLTRGM